MDPNKRKCVYTWHEWDGFSAFGVTFCGPGLYRNVFYIYSCIDYINSVERIGEKRENEVSNEQF